jgi:hypothetical protein
MRPAQFLIVLILFLLVIAGTDASSQANINENQTTILFVDAQSGSDSNPGNGSLPLKTIQAAVLHAIANNRISIGTKITVNPGVYREFVNMAATSAQTEVPITIQAAEPGTAVIAGSDVLAAWSQEDQENTSIYTHSWTHNFGACPLPSGWPANLAPVAMRTEMVFVNGIPLTQVMSYGDMRAGTFFVNEIYNVIHAWPPASANMATAVVEAAVRPQTLNISGRSNVVLRGLVFRHAATCINQSGVTISNSSNILLDQDQALWNNWGGINASSSSSLTMHNSIASHNGGVGIQGKQDSDALFSSNETDYNNWRGAQAGLYDWGMGGTKLMWMRTTEVQGQVSYRNQGQGLWFDTDNKDIAIDNATLAQNVMAALQLEASEGPISLTDSVLCSSGAGVNVINTDALTMDGNFLYNNGGTNTDQADLFIAGNPGGRVIKDWQTGQTYNLITSDMTVNNNVFADASSGQFVFGTYLNGSDWTDFANTLNSQTNQWYDSHTTYAFRLPEIKLVNLAGWRSATGVDKNSEWAAPADSLLAACTVPIPSFTDFAVNLDKGAYTMTSGRVIATVRVASFGYGPVTLRVSGLPAGVSATLSHASIVSGTVTLVLAASDSAVSQSVPITLWAYDKNRVHSATVYLQVAPKANAQ